MKAEEVYAKLKNLIELDEGIGKKTEIDDTNISNKTTYSSEKIVKEIEALKTSQSLDYEGENITCKNTLTSRTSDVVIKGKTYQNPDTGGIESAGEKENKINILSNNNKLVNDIDYRQDKKEVLLPIKGGLKSLPNGVYDTIEQRTDGVYLVQKVGKYDIKEDDIIKIDSSPNQNNTIAFAVNVNATNIKIIGDNICNNFNRFASGDLYWNSDKEGILNSSNSQFKFRILKSKLSTQDIDGIKAWLKANPTTVCYEINTPVETKLDINNLDLEVYEGTTYITTDNAIHPVLSLKILSNIGGVIQANAQNINKLYKLINNSADNINYQNSNYPLWTNVKKTLDGIIAKIDYIKPEITSFTSTAQAVYEVGQRVSNIVFNWTTNKNVTTQTLTDCTINADSRTATYTNEISSNKTFTLTVGDGQNTVSKSISIAFRNKIYYGSSVIPSNFNSAFILGLSKKQFATGKSGSFSITVGSNEYGFIAFPSSFGTLSSVKIGGFDTDVTSCGNISFTNSSGGVATYSIYRTGRHSLGAITMVIS